MNDTRIGLQKAINANPRDRSVQLVYSDFLEEHGETRKANMFRNGFGGGCGGGVGSGVGGVGVGVGKATTALWC